MSEVQGKRWGLGLTRRPDETWLDAALRLAKRYALEFQVKEDYDHARSNGVSEEEAALYAVMEWDVAEIIEDDA